MSTVDFPAIATSSKPMARRQRMIQRARHHTARTRHHTRRAVRRSAPELRTLVKFTVVGGSGVLVNYAIFAALAHVAGVHYVLAAVISFVGAVGNNFHWNRRWTFNAVGAAAIHRQAQRFLVVSTLAFLLSLGVLHLLVSGGASPLVGQAIALAVATPVGFLGNRLWTFAEPVVVGSDSRL